MILQKKTRRQQRRDEKKARKKTETKRFKSTSMYQDLDSEED